MAERGDLSIYLCLREAGSFIILLWCLCLAGFAHAAPPYILNENSEPELLGLYLDILEDKDGSLTIEQVSSPEWHGQFTENTSNFPNLGYTDSAYWFRLEIKNATVRYREMFLGIGNARASHLDVYISQQNGSWQHSKTGSVYPFSQRPLPLPDYFFPVDIEPEQTRQVYIRLQTQYGVTALIELLNAEQMIAEQYFSVWFPAIFYGALLALSFYNLFLFFTVRDQIYLYYIFMNISVVLFNMMMQGYTFQFLWPDMPAMNSPFRHVSSYTANLSFLLLTQQFLDLKNQAKKLNLALNIVIVFILLCIVVSFLLPPVVTSRLILLSIFLFAAGCLFSSFYMGFKGSRPARFLMLAWSVVMTAILTRVLVVLGILPIEPNIWLEQAPSLSILGFSILVSMGLADRINVMRAEKQAAKDLALREAREKQHIAEENLNLTKDNARMSAELDLTRELQQMVLPNERELKSIPGLEIAGFMRPADKVGGDYYDVLHYKNKSIICIGDVTGHGLDSGILMLMVQTAIRSLVVSEIHDAKTFFENLNTIIYDNLQRMGADKNLTLLMIDYDDGKVRLSGQHEEAIIVRQNGKVERLDTFDLGFIVGVVADISDFVKILETELAPEDCLVLYTDGITEAFDGEQTPYGVERLCEMVQSAREKTSHEIKQIIIDDVLQHINKDILADDLTLLVLKQKAAEATLAA